MEHQYSKFEKKNLLYVKVGRRVFGSLFDVEEYCSAHGLNVDQAIEYGESKDLKVKVQEIAFIQKAILKAAKERLEARNADLKKEMNLCIQNLDIASPLEQNYWNDRMKEVIGRCNESYDAICIVSKINEELERLTGWRND